MGSRKGRGGAAATPAIVALRDAGIDHTVHTYEVTGDAAYGDEAARVMGDRLGVAADRVFKTLVLATGRPPEGSRVTLVTRAYMDKMQQLKAAAAALGCGKATLAPIDVAEKSTGYVVGGVSPVGQRRPLATVVDASALAHPTILCSAGRRGWEIELAPAELVAITRAVTAPIAAG